MRKSIIALAIACAFGLSACSGLTVKATYQYPAPEAK